ncbi:uncharacterized protein LTHEOB_1867 [Lasiodiplodia theobromae]|uniref:uncharacterized protein n=1 Tax=Lasiodiplodia theobromae TaxID=45133 RepID=UPI0015C3F168|nr:uncharacterized protein LTHEOB_1867 [Lasiodiplodia theobromae]KAF4536106.1 hypothetical protein LTHEOB_1867 [Lasiodiplodia theobromae]
MADATPPTEKPRPSPGRRRDKPQLSCTLCRRRNPVQGRRDSAVAPGIQARITQLENLVVTLMNAAPTPPKSLSPLDTALSDSFGRISLENDETTYVSGDHWLAILDGITELKYHFDPETSPLEEEGPKLLYGSNDHATRESILASLPQRPAADRLVSKYFNAMDMAAAVIHGPTFLRDYEKFWSNPAETPIMWIGLLFAIMGVGALIQQRQSQSAANRQMVEVYKEMTVQCLILGKYTKGVPHTIETILLYFSLEHLVAADTRVDNWILAGIIVRLALRMGYHRDPCRIPQMSPFQAEMRRRVWATIVHIDLVTSTHVGLPRMLSASACDTAEPRNLLDSDFDEDAVELPPSRPDSDMTPIIYLKARNKLLSILGMITDLTTSTSPTSYGDVMELDRRLRSTHSAIPAGLQLRPLSQSIISHPDIITRSIYLDLMFNKARCILHRKYLIVSRSNMQYAYSRDSCIDAASQILKHQEVLYCESQQGGQLFSERWKMTSIFNYDFLLAITILCLDLNRDLELASSSSLHEMPAEQGRRKNVIHALQRSYNIWTQTTDSSREARNAVEILRVVLEKVKRSPISGNGNDPSAKDATHVEGAGISQPSQTPISWTTQALTSSPGENMEDLASTAHWSTDFDWDSWDADLRSQNSAQLSNMERGLMIFDHDLTESDAATDQGGTAFE